MRETVRPKLERFLAPERMRPRASVVAACLLVVTTVMLVTRFAPAFAPASVVLDRTLLALCTLAIALLAAMLWVARTRIQLLEAKEAEALRSAGVDPLTGLPNRTLFERLLETAIAQSSADAPLALFALDIDKFKNVNDTHGHRAGDLVLAGVTKRIKRVIRDGDFLARLGGDEFALLLTGITSAAECAATAHRLLDAMIAPFDTGAEQVHATLSIGVALGPQDGDTAIALHQAADLSLYRAKREGRNRFAFFDKTMEQQLRLGKRIEDDLRAAIRRDELIIVYQPLMARCGRRMQGLEALVRWEHPELGPVSPEQFIPLAENRGLIVQLGEWVLRRACRDAKRWPGLRMAVNVSPVQFRQRGFVQKVAGIIAESGIEAARLDLELTEGVLIQDAEQAEAVIVDLRALGCRMGLDDFGSGYSSMIYLRRFAFDKIKIDRAFLESMEPNGEGAIILESIVSLGHALGLTVTAEGIEHKAQVEFLQKLGCDEMQGYFFAPPLPAEEIDQRLSLEAWAEPSLATEPAPADAAAARQRSAA